MRYSRKLVPKRLILLLSLESSETLGGSGGPMDSSPLQRRVVCRCPDVRRYSACGSRYRVALGRFRVVIPPETVSVRMEDLRSPCPDRDRGESSIRRTTLSASNPLQKSSESWSQSILRLRGEGVSPQGRSESFATSVEGTI